MNYNNKMYLYAYYKTPVACYEPKVSNTLYGHIKCKNKQDYIQKRKLVFGAITNIYDKETAIKKQFTREENMWLCFYKDHPIIKFLERLPKNVSKFIKSAISEIEQGDTEHSWTFFQSEVSHKMISNLIYASKLIFPSMYYFISYGGDLERMETNLKIYWYKDNVDEISFNKYIFHK